MKKEVCTSLFFSKEPGQIIEKHLQFQPWPTLPGLDPEIRLDQTVVGGPQAGEGEVFHLHEEFFRCVKVTTQLFCQIPALQRQAPPLPQEES